MFNISLSLVYHPVLGKLLAAVFTVVYTVLVPHVSYTQNLQNFIVIICSSVVVLNVTLCTPVRTVIFKQLHYGFNCKASSGRLIKCCKTSFFTSCNKEELWRSITGCISFCPSVDTVPGTQTAGPLKSCSLDCFPQFWLKQELSCLLS